MTETRKSQFNFESFEVKVYQDPKRHLWVAVRPQDLASKNLMERSFSRVASRIYKKHLSGVKPERLHWIQVHVEENQIEPSFQGELSWNGQEFSAAKA